MHQPVQYTAVIIEGAYQVLNQAGVSLFIQEPNRVGNKVRDL